MTEQPTVLVTAIGGGGVGEQIVKALRTAGSYRIIGADMNPETPQFRLVDQAVILPRANDPEYIDAVLSVATQRGAVAVFYGSEAELKVMSAARDRFSAAGLFLPLNPPDVISTCMDKMATAEFFQEHGIPAPRSVRSVDGDTGDAGDWLPVVVKPISASGGSRDVYIAQTARQLDLIVELFAGQEMMIQEYVGRPDLEFTVGVLHGMDGQYINSIAVHRRLGGQLNLRLSVQNTSGREELGETLAISTGISHGYVDRFPEVTEPCRRIAAELGATGPVNIQCRLVDGEAYVFEINPRFSGTTSIRAMMGYNEPDILVRAHVSGELPEPDFPYDHGLVLRSLTETIVERVTIPGWRDLG